MEQGGKKLILADSASNLKLPTDIKNDIEKGDIDSFLKYIKQIDKPIK